MQADKKKKNHCLPIPLNSTRANAGFTLLEVLAAVAILGVVTMMVVPSMGRWLAHYRLVGTTNEMVAALRLAQSQAVIRKREVWMCARHSFRPGCGDGNRNIHQWLVAVPELGAKSTSADEEVVRLVEISPSLQVRDCLLDDNRFKVSANGRFYKTEGSDVYLRICAPELAGNNGTREIRTNGGLVQVTKNDASCSQQVLCT